MYISDDPQRVLTYQVNFPIYLEDISIETKLFEYFGFEIPVFVQNVILQVGFCQYILYRCIFSITEM